MPCAPLPLSFQQRFHWDNSQRLSDLNLNFPFALHIAGALNIERLRESFETVIRRQGALRTRIAMNHGEPRQVVDLPGRFRLEVVPRPFDLIGEVEAYLNNPFVLVGGKLLRARLVRLSRHEHILLVCAHHPIMDAYSVSCLADELWHSYSLRVPSLPPLHAQYSDYTLRQRQTHASWQERNGGYWSDRLADAVPLRLPGEHSVAVDYGTSVGNFQIEFEGGLTAALDCAARRWQTMPAMLVLTAFIATLSRWSKQSDFLVPLVPLVLAGAPAEAILAGLRGELELSPFPFRFQPRYLNIRGRSEHGPTSDVPALGLQVTQGSAVEATLLYSAGSLSAGSIEVFADNLRLLLESAVG